jgi:hypothetical protein
LQTLQEEDRRLEEELQAAAAATAPAASHVATIPAAAKLTAAAAATSGDATTQLLLTLTQTLLAQQQAVKPPDLPKWNGDESTKRFFLGEIKTFKKHKYFSTVTDRSKADAAHQEHSLHLRQELLRTIPVMYCPTYTEEPEFYDGFVFLKHYLDSISPDQMDQSNSSCILLTLPLMRLATRHAKRFLPNSTSDVGWKV